LRGYIPQSRAELPELRNYACWVAGGHLTATPGEITDYDYIEADIRADAERHVVLEVAADPHNATMLLTHLQNAIGRDKVVGVPQNVAHLSEPMKEVQALIVDGRLHHDGNPAFAWMMGNVTALEDRNQNVFPRKERPDKKIDAAVALILAVGAALRHASTPTSIWRPL
jgi:phage terminase large subunit-like protein